MQDRLTDKAKQALLDAGVGQDIIASGGKTLEKAIDDRSEKAFAEYCFAISYQYRKQRGLSLFFRRREILVFCSMRRTRRNRQLRHLLLHQKARQMEQANFGTRSLKQQILGEHALFKCRRKHPVFFEQQTRWNGQKRHLVQPSNQAVRRKIAI